MSDGKVVISLKDGVSKTWIKEWAYGVGYCPNVQLLPGWVHLNFAKQVISFPSETVTSVEDIN